MSRSSRRGVLRAIASLIACGALASCASTSPTIEKEAQA